jgi:hypothetical protein
VKEVLGKDLFLSFWGCSPAEETVDLKSIQGGFESHHPYFKIDFLFQKKGEKISRQKLPVGFLVLL